MFCKTFSKFHRFIAYDNAIILLWPVVTCCCCCLVVVVVVIVIRIFRFQLFNYFLFESRNKLIHRNMASGIGQHWASICRGTRYPPLFHHNLNRNRASGKHAADDGPSIPLSDFERQGCRLQEWCNLQL